MKETPLLFFVLVLTAALLAASEPWKEKKYTDWSDKDIEKVLRDSPWAKTVNLALSAPGGGAPGSGRRGSPGGGGGFGSPSSEPADPVMGSMNRERGAEVESGGARREIPLIVRWQTALPVRQALARRQLDTGRFTPEKAAEYLRQIPDRYVVVVSGMPRPVLAGTNPEKLKAETVLKTGDGQKIALEDIKMSTAQLPDIFFIFPRTADLGVNSKTVEFITTLGRFEIRKKFSLKDMVVEGKPEL